MDRPVGGILGETYLRVGGLCPMVHGPLIWLSGSPGTHCLVVYNLDAVSFRLSSVNSIEL